MRLVLAFLLVVWAPFNLALAASAVIDRLLDRGLAAIALLIARLAVTGFGVAAGRALWNRRPGAMMLARWASGLSLAVVVVLATTSIWPTSLAPGIREPVAIANVAWHALWFAWTLWSPTGSADGSSESDTR